MYPKVSTQPVVRLCSVVTAGRLSLGRFYSYAAFFARFTYGRGTFVATAPTQLTVDSLQLTVKSTANR